MARRQSRYKKVKRKAVTRFSRTRPDKWVRDVRLNRFRLSPHVYQADRVLTFSLPKWEDAMGSCFLFEAHVRLLAGKYFAGESVSRNLGDGPPDKDGRVTPGLLTMLFRKIEFSDQEQDLLRKCNGIRNKLIHCEPDALMRALQKMVVNFKPPNQVIELNIGVNATGAEIIEILQTQRGAVPVQNTVSRERGFHGWMLEAATNGTFEVAVEVFRWAIDILNPKFTAPVLLPSDPGKDNGGAVGPHPSQEPKAS